MPGGPGLPGIPGCPDAPGFPVDPVNPGNPIGPGGPGCPNPGLPGGPVNRIFIKTVLNQHIHVTKVFFHCYYFWRIKACHKGAYRINE